MQGKLLPYKAYWTKRRHGACPMVLRSDTGCSPEYGLNNFSGHGRSARCLSFIVYETVDSTLTDRVRLH